MQGSSDISHTQRDWTNKLSWTRAPPGERSTPGALEDQVKGRKQRQAARGWRRRWSPSHHTTNMTSTTKNIDGTSTEASETSETAVGGGSPQKSKSITANEGAGNSRGPAASTGAGRATVGVGASQNPTGGETSTEVSATSLMDKEDTDWTFTFLQKDVVQDYEQRLPVTKPKKRRSKKPEEIVFDVHHEFLIPEDLSASNVDVEYDFLQEDLVETSTEVSATSLMDKEDTDWTFTFLQKDVVQDYEQRLPVTKPKKRRRKKPEEIVFDVHHEFLIPEDLSASNVDVEYDFLQEDLVETSTEVSATSLMDKEDTDWTFTFLQKDVVQDYEQRFPVKKPKKRRRKKPEEIVFDVNHEFLIPEDLCASNVDVEYDFLQEDLVNPSIMVSTGKKCLTTKAKRTGYSRIEAQRYAGVVKKFCGDDTDTTIPELNRVKKYWIQRHLLFMRFDAGILLDHESFYSVCPEVLAKHIADRCRFPDGVAVDPFCGAGGNIIQLAKTCRKVIAMDIDGKKLEMARHNAGVYGVAGSIEFRQNDFFAGPSGQRANVVVTSPPWGGPEYLRQDLYSPSVMCEAYGGGEAIVRIARSMAPKLALHLPRTVDKSECIAIAKKLCFTRIKFEDNFINDRLNSTTVFLSY